MKFFLNSAIAQKVYKHLIVYSIAPDSYLFDQAALLFYRVNWEKPLEVFPREVPEDIPDIIFQMGSGLYGVRDGAGKFDPKRYEKVMRFCRMTEIKIAQGAKQTGGKLLAPKVSQEIAYYRGVEAHKDLFSPNRFPYVESIEQLFEFIRELKTISQKPVGIKIVVSSEESFKEYAQMIKNALDNSSQNYPDFITVDGAEGGSGAAPLEMMLSVGKSTLESLEIVNTILKEYGVREQVKLIVSGKILTPDDAVIALALGADFIAIARAFMMSAGCIRARECSGANGKACPVGLATQDKRKRASFLVEKKAKNIANYHAQLLKGVQELLVIMGLKDRKQLEKKHLFFQS